MSESKKMVDLFLANKLIDVIAGEQSGGAWPDDWQALRARLIAALTPADHPVDPNKTIERIAALEAENAGLRADAERHRWLRDESEGDEWSIFYPHPYEKGATQKHYGGKNSMRQALDAAIDAARSGERT